MKWLQPITLLAAVLAVVLSLYSLLAKPPYPEIPRASTPEALVKRVLQLPRWDGAGDFFAAHQSELISNLVIVDFFESNGSGIAFVRTKADGKTLQFCHWMRKSGGNWHLIGYLSRHLTDALVVKWIKANEAWLRDMEDRKEKWEAESDDVWMVEEKDSATSAAGRADQSKRAACLNNLRQINAGTQQYMLENGTTKVPDIAQITDMFAEKKLPTCPAGGTYTKASSEDQLPTCSLGQSHKHRLGE